MLAQGINCVVRSNRMNITWITVKLILLTAYQCISSTIIIIVLSSSCTKHVYILWYSGHMRVLQDCKLTLGPRIGVTKLFNHCKTLIYAPLLGWEYYIHHSRPVTLLDQVPIEVPKCSNELYRAAAGIDNTCMRVYNIIIQQLFWAINLSSYE